MTTLDRPTTLHWLMTIEASNIKDPIVRARVVKFQKDAGRVLDAAFDDDLIQAAHLGTMALD